MAQWQASLLCPVSVPHGQDTALLEPGQARLAKEAWPAKEGSHGEGPILLGVQRGPIWPLASPSIPSWAWGQDKA